MTGLPGDVISAGLKTWAYQYAANSEYGTASPPPRRGWFTRLPMWAKILFVIVYPVSIPYGIWAMWKDKRYSNAGRIAITAVAAIFLIGVFANAGRTGTSPNSPSGTAAIEQNAPAVASQPAPAPVADPAPAADPAPVADPAPAADPASLRPQNLHQRLRPHRNGRWLRSCRGRPTSAVGRSTSLAATRV